MKRFLLFRILFCLTVAFAATGCVDDLTTEITPTAKGRARVSATLDFKPMSAALARTRSSGEALKEIRSLHVLLYDHDTKERIGGWQIAEGAYTVSEETRYDTDAENGTSAETKTGRATFKLPEEINFGRYYMYVVANIPDLLTNDDYSDAIGTVDGLKALPVVWDETDVRKNGQMMGCFTNDSSVPGDESLELSEKSEELHAWLRRAASKVTVAFDGSGLKDQVAIYIKSLRIRNIPASCKLGMDNKADETSLIGTGSEEIVYSTSTNYDESYPALITNELPFYPRKREGDRWVKDPEAHSETSPNTLFFYENMQGKGPDKKQYDKNGDGILDDKYPYREMADATYIEVETRYESSNPDRPGVCNITYRFMLGQDVDTDYNAKRNCHYKLTLRFNGFADEPDWRIDYVTRLWVTQPEEVDYRGKYLKPDYSEGVYNLGNTFGDDNAIVVTSFMYLNDSWEEFEPLDYKIEYRDAGSTEFTETPPDWLGEFDTKDDNNGTYTLTIKYNNPYTTQDIGTKLSDNDAKSGVYDLATKGGTEAMNTANCYVVDSKGTYQFPLVYGNAVVDNGTNEASYRYQGTYSSENKTKRLDTFLNYKNEPIDEPYILEDIYPDGNVPADLSASLVWQDARNLIDPKTITYDKSAYGGKGGIRFTVGDIAEGNAVIALKDPAGTVMWSWHIWVTAIDLSNNITLKHPLLSPDEWTTLPAQSYAIMPVNLGWCSGGTPIRYYARHECEVRFTQFIGEGQQGVSRTVKIIQQPHVAVPRGNNPYFQWGRKDPFVAGGGGNHTTKTWYDEGNNPYDTAPARMYSDEESRVETYKATASLIRNPDKWQNGPHKFIGGITYEPVDTIYFNLWDNSCWDGNEFVVKTVYDPCPVGYHVSSRCTFAGFSNNGGNIGSNWQVMDIENHMYAATEDNMMAESAYRDGIVEFYTDRTKLISLGFPTNGYRDWDDDAAVLKYDENEGQIWHAQGVPFSWAPGPYDAYHFEYSRGTFPRIWPINAFYATDGFAVRPSVTLP